MVVADEVKKKSCQQDVRKTDRQTDRKTERLFRIVIRTKVAKNVNRMSEN